MSRIMSYEQIKMARAVLEQKTRELDDISTKLTKHPYYHLIRPRYFEFAPGIIWPLREPLACGGYDVNMNAVHIISEDSTSWAYLHDLPHDVIVRCNYQPRCIVRAMRRIDAAIRWCEKRIKGLNRHYQQILEQQKDAVKKIEAEFVMQKLREE